MDAAMPARRSLPFSPGPTRNLNGPRTTCIIDPDNEASVRLARRFRFVEFGRGAYNGKQAVLFERVRPREPV